MTKPSNYCAMNDLLKSALIIAVLSALAHFCNPNLPMEQKALVVLVLCAVVARYYFLGSFMGAREDSAEHAENRSAAMEAFKQKRFVPKTRPEDEPYGDDVDEDGNDALSQGDWVEVTSPKAGTTDKDSSS